MVVQEVKYIEVHQQHERQQVAYNMQGAGVPPRRTTQPVSLLIPPAGDRRSS